MAVVTTHIEFTETNADLDYATHGYFRYFGKLPPVVTRFAVERGMENAPAGAVIDLMCGSGTTLVECMLMGLDSVGVDVNPLSVLISRVKTTILPVKVLRQQLENLYLPIRRDISVLRGQLTLGDDGNASPDLSYIDESRNNSTVTEVSLANHVFGMMEAQVFNQTHERAAGFFDVPSRFDWTR